MGYGGSVHAVLLSLPQTVEACFVCCHFVHLNAIVSVHVHDIIFLLQLILNFPDRIVVQFAQKAVQRFVAWHTMFVSGSVHFYWMQEHLEDQCFASICMPMDPCAIFHM